MRKTIVASVIVATALMLGISSISPAVASEGGEEELKVTGPDCEKIFSKLLDALGPKKANEIFSKIVACHKKR